jgi:hypothetical protein
MRRKPAELKQLQGRRLRGLEEFQPPPFIGRMERVERRRRLAWWAMMAGGVALGVGVGLRLF